MESTVISCFSATCACSSEMRAIILALRTRSKHLKKSLPNQGRRRLIHLLADINRSSRLAERALHASLQGSNRVRCHLLRQTRQVLGLLGEVFKLLARVRGPQFQELGWRFHTNQLTGKIESGSGVEADDLNPLHIEVCCALGERGVRLLNHPVGLLRGGFGRFVYVLGVGRALSGKLSGLFGSFGTIRIGLWRPGCKSGSVVHGTLLGRNFESALPLVSLCGALHVALQ